MDIKLCRHSSVGRQSRGPNSCFVFRFLLPTTMTTAPVAPCINEVLPEEVFGVIFEEHAKLEWRAPLIDGQVCRQWRQTILRSPRTWAHLEIGKKFQSAPSKLRQWLDRSGSSPLHIRAMGWFQGGFQGEGEVLGRHRERIESISFHGHCLAFLENKSFPILQSLTIGAWNINNPVIHWSAWRAMPNLRYLRATCISMGALPSDLFPPLRVLALYMVHDCDFIIQNTYHSLTSLMLRCISLKYTSESLEFPSLKFLSLFAVDDIKHRMNVPALTTYHEGGRIEEESFSMSLPFLIEYGIRRINNKSPLNVTRLHQCYPNISQLSVRAYPSDVKQFLHSLSRQPNTLPMLRILALGALYESMESMEYSGEDKESMMNDVLVRNMASSVKMELCFDGMVRIPLRFGNVRFILMKVKVNSHPLSGPGSSLLRTFICSRIVECPSLLLMRPQGVGRWSDRLWIIQKSS